MLHGFGKGHGLHGLGKDHGRVPGTFAGFGKDPEVMQHSMNWQFQKVTAVEGLRGKQKDWVWKKN